MWKNDFIWCGICKKCKLFFNYQKAFEQVDDNTWGNGINKKGFCKECADFKLKDGDNDFK